MARPIRETPILFGEDARRFEKRMKNPPLVTKEGKKRFISIVFKLDEDSLSLLNKGIIYKVFTLHGFTASTISVLSFWGHVAISERVEVCIS